MGTVVGIFFVVWGRRWEVVSDVFWSSHLLFNFADRQFRSVTGDWIINQYFFPCSLPRSNLLETSNVNDLLRESFFQVSAFANRRFQAREAKAVSIVF